MPAQVSMTVFENALSELGHDPSLYRGQRLTITNMCKLYEMSQDSILDAIDQRQIAAHYDYFNDTIWIDALAAAHFYYCVRSTNETLSA